MRIRYAPQIATTKTRDLERPRVERRVEDEPEHGRDRQPEDDHDDLPAGEAADVVVQRMASAAASCRRQLPLADPPLPPVGREDDVHVPDERPDDVVRGELAGRDAADRAALLVGDRRPHDEVDHRLGDHPDHVDVVGDAVLELLGDHRPAAREVEGDVARAMRADLGQGSAERSLIAFLREDELDHVLDRRVLDRQVGDVLLGEQARR